MNACILLRYFTHVRVQAITRILIKHKTLPSTFLTHTLAFDNNDDYASFMEYYGLATDDDDKVWFDRNKFKQPDVPFKMKACNVVDSRMLTSVAEAVHGKILDSPYDFRKHCPQNSFDSVG